MWIHESRFFHSMNFNGAVGTVGSPQSTILILFGPTTTTQKTGSGNQVDSNSAYKRLHGRPPIRLQVKMANKRNKNSDKPMADSLISSAGLLFLPVFVCFLKNRSRISFYILLAFSNRNSMACEGE